MKMWEHLDDCGYVLEPSAGKGDLVDFIVNDREYGWRKAPRVDCIEIDPELAFTLKGKGYSVVHNDFMDFNPVRNYDGIIMNPPFDKGAEHLLRAWDMLGSGKVVCLLNSETVNNPYTKKRELLLRAIDEHGTVEDLGRCFTDAERRTSVNVSLVVLEKVADRDRFGFFDELEASGDEHADFNVEEAASGGIMKPDIIRTMTERYRKAAEAHVELLRAVNKVHFYTDSLNSQRTLNRDAITPEFRTDAECYNHFLDELNMICWDEVFRQTGVSKFVTRGVREEFDTFKEGSQRIDFTEENIMSLVQTLGMSAGNIMEKALLDVFDNLTMYDEKNKVHIEGWKTNDAWRVNRKVIVPYVIDKTYNGDPDINSWHSHHVDELQDLDRVLCNMTGRNFDGIVTIIQGLQKAFGEQGWGGTAFSEFFTMKYYKKGTLHLTFKDEKVWEDFNVAAAKGKKWLPGDR